MGGRLRQLQKQTVCFTKTRGFFQCLQYVTPGGGVIIHPQQLRQAKMHVRRVGGIEQEEFLISADGLVGFAKLLTGGGQKSVRLGHQRIHGDKPFGILINGLPILIALRKFHQA